MDLMARRMENRWIDISVPLRGGLVHWPGDPPVEIERVRDMERGDSSNLSAISMSLHAGTHMDAPRHFIRSGHGIDRMPLTATVGLARVIEIRDRESIKVQEILPHRLRAGERILFKTENSARCWKTDSFVTDFVHLSTEAAAFLAERRVATVGIDYLSVGGYHDDGAAVHRTLLAAGVWIIEGLDLSRAGAGSYDLICLPLRVVGSDGAPARAIVRPILR
jgi:arylformamidase